MRLKIKGLLLIGLLSPALFALSGCAGKTAAASPTASNFSRPVAGGMKPASQVAACCRPLAEGKISLDRCMANPQCVANSNRCCMNAF